MVYIGQNYGIYWAKHIDFIIGYIQQKLWDILGKTMGYILKNMGNI